MKNYTILLISCFLLSCASKNEPIIRQIQSELNQAIKDNQAFEKKPLPKAVQDMLLPPVTIPDDVRIPKIEDKFDIQVKDLAAQTFFLSLVMNTPYNMIVHPDIIGQITLNLKQVTIPEVMKALQQVYNYHYTLSNHQIQVLPRVLESRIYTIDYINIARTGSSLTKVSSAQTRVGGSDSGDSPTNQVSTETTANFWNELSEALNTIITTENGRRIAVTPHTGTIVIRAMPSELAAIETLLKTYQNRLNRQVILEAKILEVILNDGFQSGINWTGLSRIEGNGDVTFQNIPGQPLINNFDVNLGGIFRTVLNIDDFSAVIDLLKEQGSVQTLSNPRISTVNNQKAIIKVGSDEFFVTDITIQNVVDQNGNQLQPEVEVDLTQFFSGIALDITPQINERDEVILHIHPTITDVQEQNKFIELGNGNNLNLPLALNNVRESDTVIRAKSGQIILLGGLMQKIAQEDTASTPFFGDIPYVGQLFKQIRQNSVKSELVILIRPWVMQHTHDWSAPIQHSIRGLDVLQRQLQFGGDPQLLGR